MSLANQIVDFVDDIDKSILKIAAAQAPKDLVSSNILNAEDRERLDPGQFALVIMTKEAHTLKKFPTTDKANTWLSCQYFTKTAEQLPYVAQKIAATNLKRACLLYGLDTPSEVEKLASVDVNGNRYNELKSYKEDKMHTNSVKIEEVTSDGSEHFYALGEKYAMPNATFVKKASAYFIEHHKEFTDAEDRYIFAYHVKERAKELETELDKTAMALLSTYSGSAYGDSVESQLRLRHEVLQNKPEMCNALSKLASHKSTTEPTVFAKALYLFDKKAGITRYYDGFLADAFKSTFGNLRKTAAPGYAWEDKTSGEAIDGSLLEKAAEDKYEKIKSYFGNTLADSLKKHAVSIFESLPVDAKITIVKIAKGAL
jgi:hypothetical protein